jgi:hypothetical protein
MTDDDVLEAVRECLTAARDRAAGEQMTRTARAIIAWARRRRLRQGLAAAATAAVIAAAVAVPALLAGNGTSPARLAAWTVTIRPGGRLIVTIRELRDAAGLQRRLRADGVPATVRPINQLPRPCLYYRLPPKQNFRLMDRIFSSARSTRGQTVFTINTTAIPAHIGLWINLGPPRAHIRYGRGAEFAAFWTLVYASGRCPPGPLSHTFTGGGVEGGPSR